MVILAGFSESKSTELFMVFVKKTHLENSNTRYHVTSHMHYIYAYHDKAYLLTSSVFVWKALEISMNLT